jgi:hypothetical protein
VTVRDVVDGLPVFLQRRLPIDDRFRPRRRGLVVLIENAAELEQRHAGGRDREPPHTGGRARDLERRRELADAADQETDAARQLPDDEEHRSERRGESESLHDEILSRRRQSVEPVEERLEKPEDLHPDREESLSEAGGEVERLRAHDPHLVGGAVRGPREIALSECRVLEDERERGLSLRGGGENLALFRESEPDSLLRDPDLIEVDAEPAERLDLADEAGTESEERVLRRSVVERREVGCERDDPLRHIGRRSEADLHRAEQVSERAGRLERLLIRDTERLGGGLREPLDLRRVVAEYDADFIDRLLEVARGFEREPEPRNDRERDGSRERRAGARDLLAGGAERGADGRLELGPEPPEVGSDRDMPGAELYRCHVTPPTPRASRRAVSA